MEVCLPVFRVLLAALFVFSAFAPAVAAQEPAEPSTSPVMAPVVVDGITLFLSAEFPRFLRSDAQRRYRIELRPSRPTVQFRRVHSSYRSCRVGRSFRPAISRS